MPIRIVRLGSPRAPDEGLRIGTVRRPPRGIASADHARGDWYDVWYPNLAPTAPTVAMARDAQTPAQWRAFARRYRAEMATPDNRRTIALLAALSRTTAFSVGCYCENEARCHRSLLRTLLAAEGAVIVD